MDKQQEESRRQFEEWWVVESWDKKLSNIQGVMFNRIKQGMFDSWQSSRASIVVEIDSYTEFEIEHIVSPEKEGYSIGWIDGRNYAAKQVRSIGLSIKGE